MGWLEKEGVRERGQGSRDLEVVRRRHEESRTEPPA